MPKPVVSAAERERVRQEIVAAAARAGLAADFVRQLEAAGWTNAKAVTKATFYAISGDDPQGVNHSAADADGQAAVDHLLQAGAAPPPRKKPEPEAKPAPAAAAPPPFDQEADEFRHPDRHAYDEEPETVSLGAEDVGPMPSGVLEQPGGGEPPSTEEPPVIPADDHNAAVEDTAEALAGPPLVLDQVVGGPSPERAGGVQTEAIPDPLARLVPPNLTLAAQKEWASRRWIELNARLNHMAMLPPEKRPLPDLSKAEEGELELLNRWVSWFS